MRRLTILLTVLLAAPPASSAADIAKGKSLHDEKCVGCHVKRFGGDGSEIYTRANRIIKSREALGQRVATCNAMVSAGLLPEDEENIAAYLAQRYYKFK